MAVKVAVDHGKHGRKSIPVLAGWMSVLYVEPDSAEQHGPREAVMWSHGMHREP